MPSIFDLYKKHKEQIKDIVIIGMDLIGKISRKYRVRIGVKLLQQKNEDISALVKILPYKVS